MPRLAPVLIALGLMASGCAQKPMLRADKGYVRLPASRANPAAAYFTLHGGDQPARLISVSSPVAVRTEIHRSMSSGGVETMSPVPELRVPARGTVAFAPGGLHAMLFTLNPVVKPGGTVPLVLTFADGTRIEYDAPAIAAGDAAPK